MPNQSHPTSSRAALLMGLLVLIGAQPAYPDLIPDFRLDWATVGRPGNVAFIGRGSDRWDGYGSLDYSYRITKTEITTEQYYHFVTAFAPHFDGDLTDPDLTGEFIYYDGVRFRMIEGWEKAPTNMSIRNGARFANWMHNGQVHEEWAFTSGVYDTSTFGWNEDEGFTDDYTRSPDARYWTSQCQRIIEGQLLRPEPLRGRTGGVVVPAGNAR